MRFLLLPLALLFIFNACQPDTSQADLYSAMPKSSVIIIETHDFKAAVSKISATSLYSEADSLPPLLAFAERLESLGSLFAEDERNAFLKNRPALIACALSGAEKYNLLFATPGDPEFEKSISTRFSENFRSSEKNYSGADIFRFYKEDDSREYFVSSYKGVILFSTSITLLEEGIRQMNSELNIRQEPQFQKLYQTSNKKDLANIYIRTKDFPGLAKKILPLGQAAFVSRFGQWAELDLRVLDQELIMSGLLLFPESEAYHMQNFSNLSAQETKAETVVPSSSGLWVGFTFSNAETYYRNYLDYLERAGRLRTHDQLLEKLEFDHEAILLNWVDSEMGLFLGGGKAGQVNYIGYLKYRDEEDASNALGTISDPDFIEGYRGMIIKKLAPENALPRFYGPLFQNFHQPYYFLAKGFVLFAEDVAVLKGVINDILDEKTLSVSEEYQEFNGRIPAESHLKVIASNPAFLPYLATGLEGSDAKVLEKYAGKLQNFQYAALQLNVEDKDAALVNFYLLHSATQKEEVTRLWNVQLESEAANVPQFLKNHLNAKYDITVQDKDNRLYLIDHTGKILWTKMLDGPLMGNITQVDLYKNNKLQMVFNTRDKLYVVDRLGRDVENFPVNLPEKATAPVGVFNYDQARNYRFVVPCGPILRNYDLSGKQVSGWNFKKAAADIITRPQHFSVKKRDVIVILTADGKLQQLNRRGEKRFETITGLPTSLQIPFYLKEGESLAQSEMLSIGPNGKLYAIHPGATTDSLYLDQDHPADHFLYFDDKYIFTSDELLLVKSDRQPWQAEMEGKISVQPKAMIFRNNFYAGAFSADAEEIRLFNAKGELIDGFPVFAQGAFDMGSLKQDGSINIVTYSEDGTLICYRVE